ncbi:hypothetical protein BGK55_16225 [Xanthomonas citri pv. malvacearum]|nr:hypothetical protein BGK55_16225 [Xanthomonas citri pv. malvacearum]
MLALVLRLMRIAPVGFHQMCLKAFKVISSFTPTIIKSSGLILKKTLTNANSERTVSIQRLHYGVDLPGGRQANMSMSMRNLRFIRRRRCCTSFLREAGSPHSPKVNGSMPLPAYTLLAIMR